MYVGLSRKCGSLDVPRPCGPPLPVTGIAVLYIRSSSSGVGISSEDEILSFYTCS
jgi:hypothetical protein